MLPTAGASGVESDSFARFQQRVESVASKHQQAAPNVVEELKKAPTTEKDGLPKPKRVLDLGISKVVAVQGSDSKIIYMANTGRFVFGGPFFDIWQKKRLRTFEEIEYATTHIPLREMDFDPADMNSVSIGRGQEHVTIFVDVQCGWCHKAMRKIQNSEELLNKYTFDFIVVPVLSDDSEEAGKRLFCSSETDPMRKFESLQEGYEKVMELPQKEKCDIKGLRLTKMTQTVLSITSVPFIIAPDGRFSSGYPKDLEKFLSGSNK